MRWSEEVSVPDKNTKIHKVVILDCSGSMQGEKYNAAEQGVREDYKLCQDQGFADYLLVEFSSNYTEKYYKNWEPITFNPKFNSTALYSTIVGVLTKVSNQYSKDEKVLVQIFTDGQDTDSSRYRGDAAKIIKECNERGWTVTFVGTQYDVHFIQLNLNIDSTNTLVHDNTPEGMKMSFETYRGATANYSKNVSRGLDVTTGFFKDIKNTTNG